MNDRQDKTTLADRFEQQAQIYADVIDLLEQLNQTVACDAETTDLLGRITESLAAAAKLTPRASRIETERLTSRERTAIIRVRETLQRLVSQIRATENLATEARDRLLPRLNDETKRQRMLRAYSHQEASARMR
jgi:hypothetical protein